MTKAIETQAYLAAAQGAGHSLDDLLAAIRDHKLTEGMVANQGDADC